MNNAKIILLSIGAVLIAFTTIVLYLDIDLIRWFTCNSPLANPRDKTSDVCQRLERVP